MNLGTCCHCGRAAGVRFIVEMPFEAPSGFNGWGCYVCGLPMRGAIAVLCQGCREAGREPLYICGGTYIVDRKRIPLDGFEQKPFGHVLAAHPEFAGRLH